MYIFNNKIKKLVEQNWVHDMKGMMSLYRQGRFHVKGPRKQVNVEKWIFFDEMWKIISQIDDLCRFLNNFCNFGVLLAKNQKFPRMTVLKKLKLMIFFFFVDLPTYFK